jgi:hypothetical protein
MVLDTPEESAVEISTLEDATADEAAQLLKMAMELLLQGRIGQNAGTHACSVRWTSCRSLLLPMPASDGRAIALGVDTGRSTRRWTGAPYFGTL